MTATSCPNCSAIVPPGFKFCGECGTKLAPAAAPEGPKAAGPPPPAARDEFRDVSVLFADVTGFTALSEKLDPEALHALMNACFDGLGRIVQAHGGHIDKYIGDSIMALFGAPTAHEDDPVRAGEAALEMQRFLSAFGGREGLAPSAFRMRIGINCGLVLAGSIGTKGKRDYSVLGDEVNTASRLEGHARPGSILVSDAFKRRVERQFTFGEAQSVALKGKDKPVTAWELLSEAGGETARALHPGGRAFVGRTRDLARMTALLEDSRSEHSPLWIDVRGPLGIGKTHLVEEALSRLPNTYALHVVSRPATRLRPFALARRMLLAVTARAPGSSGPPQSRDEFLAALGPLRQDLGPYVNALWYLAAPDALTLKAPDPDPLTFRRTVDRGLQQLLANLAAREDGLVLVLDAFDLADAETRSFFETAYAAAGRPLPPLIATVRADDVGPPKPGTETILLTPLAPDESRRLAELAAGGNALDAQTFAGILARAGGVPLFILELVRSVQEHAGAADAGARQTAPALPSSLLGVMSSRLDRLEAGQRDVLAQCAVQGVEFSADVALLVWQGRGGAPHALAAYLKDLEERHFLQVHDRKARRYAFSQALMQNACYDSMLKRDRRALHRDVASALVLNAGGEAAVSPELLSAHYELSEQWLKAAHENLRAGQRAAQLYANADALSRFARALKALGEHGAEGEAERTIACAAHAGAGGVHLRIGQYAEAESDARAMLERAANAAEIAEANRLMAQGRLHRGDLHNAASLLGDARRLLETAGGGFAAPGADTAQEGAGVACHVLYDLADISLRKGDNTGALAFIGECRALAPPGCPELLRLDILEGRVAHTQGRFQDAVRLYERAHTAAAGTGSLSEEALTSNYMGNAARDVGRYGDAERYFARALDIWTRVGLTESMAGAHNNLANLAISRGDASRAEHHYVLALDAFEQIKNTAGTALARTNLAILAVEQGRPADGVANAGEAKALLAASGNRMLLGLAAAVSGEALIACGRIEEAAADFSWITREYEEDSHPLAIAGARRGEGRVALLRGDALSALPSLQAALALYERLAREQEAGRTELYLAQAHAAAGNGATAHSLIEHAVSRFSRIGANADLARARAALEKITQPP